MVAISVIIPVYNVEDYLAQCLDSICNQTFRDIEIICVNDGSTDHSPDILTQYSLKDERISIINQHNQGLAASRNNGLKIAKGEYVYFIDSDDYLEFDALERLYDSIVSNDSDMVLFKFQTVDDYHNVHKRGVEFKIDKIFGDIDYANFTFTYKDVKRHVMNSAFSACLKLYKRDFIADASFPIGLNFEDVPVHVKLMLEAQRLSFVPESFYITDPILIQY
jgi:glycosyltransferase involved in cell wall biosynthesis